MNWESYLLRLKSQSQGGSRFVPTTQKEAKDALALGIIDIGEYVEYSLSLEPVLDSVYDPDPEVRRDAIETLARRRDPLSIQTLYHLLTDEEEEVRLAAATTLENLERPFHMRIHRFRQELARRPEDVELRLQLAETFIEYATVLLLNPELKNFFLQKSVAELNQLVQSHPEDHRFWFARGRALQLQNRFAEAREDLRRCLELKPEFLPARVHFAECTFALHDFAEVENIMRRLPGDEADEELTDALRFWTETGAA